MPEIAPTAEAALIADDRDMASSLSPEDSFPEVFATSRMIALMEIAASRAMLPAIGPGQLSVGVTVNIKHLAATPNHTKVWAVATYLGPEGKLHKFKVEAFDPGGKIGEGEHARAIVNTDRLVQGAKTRLEGKDRGASA